LERADDLRTGQQRNSATLDQLDRLAAQAENDAATASGTNALRLRSLAATTKAIAARLRR
jgi:hypothetical protein